MPLITGRFTAAVGMVEFPIAVAGLARLVRTQPWRSRVPRNHPARHSADAASGSATGIAATAGSPG